MNTRTIEMFKYRIYGSVLESDIELPQLVSADISEEAGLFLKKTVFSEEERQRYTAEDTVLGQKLSSFWNDDLICVIQEGTTIIFEPASGSDPEKVRAFILGYGMAMLFLQRKMLAVHCSGIRVGDKAIMISGGSGAGKSSLARQFLEHGHQLMADDMMVAGVGRMAVAGTADIALAYPAFPATKLCSDLVERENIDTTGLRHITENKDKFLLPYKGDFSCEPAELEALCVIAVLAPEAAVEVVEVSGVDKMKLLIDNLFIDRSIMFDGNNPLAVSLAAQLASHIRVIVVGRPNGKDTTLEQYEKLLEKIKN